MWLSGDHYKWRLMRASGVEERYITGDAAFSEKFEKYAQSVEMALGNPLYHWSNMELKLFFDIDLPLSAKNAELIRTRANAFIQKNKISPRRLIEKANVEYIATTDDPCDSLEYHALIAADNNFATRVEPTFRTDNLLQIKRRNFREYLARLSAVSGISVTDIKSFKAAVISRLDFFCANGCRFSDVGIPDFPNAFGSETEAGEALAKRISGNEITEAEYQLFLGHMFLFLAEEYKKRDIIMRTISEHCAI